MTNGDGNESSSSHALPGWENTGSMAGFLDMAFDAVATFDSRERITHWNPAAEQLFGWKSREAMGKTPAELFRPGGIPLQQKRFQQRQSRLKRGEILRGKHNACRKDGSSLRVQYAARAIFDAKRDVTGSLVIYRQISNREQQDVIERRQREEALRARTEEVETLLEVSPVAIFVAHDPECIRISGNPAAYRLVGLPENPDLNISKSAPEQERPAYRVFRHGLEVPLQDLPMQRAARLGMEVNEDEIELRLEDGSQKFLYAFAKPLFDAQGQTRGAIATMLDITERKRTEEQLERSHQKLNEILTSIQDDFYVLDHAWKFVYANRQFTSRLGKEPEDFVGNNIWEMFPKHQGTILEENFRAAMEKREIRRFEMPGKYTNAWYRMTAFPSPEGITVLGMDISERKRSEQLLRESEEKFRNIFNQSPIGIGVYDVDGILINLNPAAMAMFGISSYEKIAGLKLFSSPTVQADARRKLRHQEQIREEVVYDFDKIKRLGFYETTKSGISYFDRIITPLRSSATGEPFGYLSQVIDITERKRLEAETESLAKFPQENPNPVLRVSQDGVVLFGNRASQKLLDDWNCSIGAPLPDSWREAVTERFRLGRPGEAMLESHGRIFSLHLVPIVERHHLNIYGRDITERRQAEEALRENQRQLQLLNETLEQQVHEKTAEVRHLASELIKAVQRERHRLSHILHDDLQQRVYAIRMQLTFLRDHLPEENETAQRDASDIDTQLDEILMVTRNLSIDLSPPILRDEGLSQAINWLAARMRQRYALPIELQADEPFALADEELHMLLFNCVRELLFNVVKHARASRAIVALRWSDADLQIEVRDDGKGFSVNTVQQDNEAMSEEGPLASSGLATIGHQLSLFGGRIEIKSEPGAGTCVILLVPLAEDEGKA